VTNNLFLLANNKYLTEEEQSTAFKAAALIRKLQVSEMAWRNPYAEAISLLQNAARAHEGSYR
jgi:hypothetical protein